MVLSVSKYPEKTPDTNLNLKEEIKLIFLLEITD